MLHKKLYTQNNSRAPVLKKCIENKKSIKKRNDDEAEERIDEGSKWVKTDSECKFIFTFIFMPQHYYKHHTLWTNEIFSSSCRYCSRDIILHLFLVHLC